MLLTDQRTVYIHQLKPSTIQCFRRWLKCGGRMRAEPTEWKQLNSLKLPPQQSGSEAAELLCWKGPSAVNVQTPEHSENSAKQQIHWVCQEEKLARSRVVIGLPAGPHRGGSGRRGSFRARDPQHTTTPHICTVFQILFKRLKSS